MSTLQTLGDVEHKTAPVRPSGEQPPPPPTPGEMRLRSVIERAPVGLLVASPDGKVLAANQSALALFAVEQLEDIVGHTLAERVGPQYQATLTDFISRVCLGECGSLEYEVVGPGDSRRIMETRAVPLPRNSISPAAFLAATWDVTDRQRSIAAAQESRVGFELVSAQRDALEETLREARQAYEELSQRHRTAQESLRETQRQLQRKDAEATARQNGVLSQWAAERDALEVKLRELQDREQELTTGLRMERDARLAELDQRAAEYQRALTAQQAEAHHLQEALSATKVDLERLVQSFGVEREQLAAKIEELESHCATLLVEWESERENLSRMLRAEKTRCAHLVEGRERWRAELASLWSTMKNTLIQAERLLETHPSGHVPSPHEWCEAAERVEQAMTTTPFDAEATRNGEDPWGF